MSVNRNPGTHSGRKFATYIVRPGDYIKDGRMSLADADAVLQEACASWGLTLVKEDDFETVLPPLVVALRDGTSAERRFADSYFSVGEKHDLCLGVLAQSCASYYKGENAVRVFARSYNSGELAHRLSEILANPLNDVMRKQATLDYGVSNEYAHLCFDFADALADCSGYHLTQFEKMLITTNTSNKVRSSRSAFVGGTDGGSLQQMSDAAATGKGADLATVQRSKNAASAVGSSSTFDTRAGFANVR